MERRHETNIDSSVVAVARLAIVVGAPTLLMLTIPFVLTGSPLAIKAFFWLVGCSTLVILTTLSAHLVNNKAQFLGVFVLLAGLSMLFRFVPPFEWQYLDNLAQGAYAGCLLGLIPASSRIKHLPAGGP